MQDLPVEVPGFLRYCARCGRRYDWRRSTSSSLKMTYCNTLCECADLGFTIDGLLRLEVSRGASLVSAGTASADESSS